MNYIYDQNGKLVEQLQDIEDRSIIFVKRDPGFDLRDREIDIIMRKLDRNQREQKSSVDSKLFKQNPINV